MGSLRVLFLGGTGVISAACVRDALEAGIDLTVLTRGRTTTRPVPDGVRTLHADVHDDDAMRAALGEEEFDVVVNFVGYTPADVQTDVARFARRTGQYVFISTGSVYARPPHLPVVESSARRHNGFDYPRNKLLCEETLERAFRGEDFPVTIVRAAHVYDRTVVPNLTGWTTIARWRAGKPVVVHGDGTSLWNLMHADDFARGLTGLLGNTHVVGENVHITSDEILSWDEIHVLLARAAGVEPRLVHRSSEDIGREIDWMGTVLSEDFRYSMVYDNSKIKRLVPGFASRVPFAQGAREIVEWFDADPSRQRYDAAMDAAFDRLVGGRDG
ncbi:NAD-dependent epimerase/dehydratase family protein [Actinopolymorpha pittospori]|uniref:Nucleoside-diphosphate-sugar epimerase n=1 Tax=Actinopolymorpha pittospori TaxID=648752 RepID=A0A927RAV4_9ACTN|nr:NAD-dependent epimerase/dehydratase family protein [Actinopolymorpha pittospori]MBE1605445.1 nucleoside-diphosphate-sugar epimerase [Actinopolymorpha pittospori]